MSTETSFKRSLLSSRHIAGLLWIFAMPPTQATAVQTPSHVFTAERAADLVDNVGVNIHISQPWTTYGSPTGVGGNTGKVLDSLSYLGLNFVRDFAPSYSATMPSSLADFETIANAGVRFDFIALGNVDISDQLSAVDMLEKSSPSAVVAIEGPNEVSLNPFTFGGQSGFAAAVGFQKSLYTAVHADKDLAGVPVYDFTPGALPADTTEYSVSAAYADYSNSHSYHGALAPAGPIDAELAVENNLFPSMPTVVTELGYYTVPNANDWGSVSEDVQAKYTLDSVMDDAAAGVQTSYIYELLDSGVDAGGLYNQQNHFGLFDADGSPKEAATAIHNLTTILADQDGAATSFKTTPLVLSVSNLPPTGNLLVLENSSGAYDIVVWAEPEIWNRSTLSEIAPPETNVLVGLGATFKTVEVYDPMAGSTPLETFTNVASITLRVTDHPLIIEVEPNTPSSVSPTPSGGSPSTSHGASISPAPTIPSIDGTTRGETILAGFAIKPFASAYIDGASGLIETVSVAMSDASDGTLSNLSGGDYDATTGRYVVIGTAAVVSAALQALVFSPAVTPSTLPGADSTRFAVTSTDVNGMTSDSTTSVTVDKGIFSGSNGFIDASTMASTATEPLDFTDVGGHNVISGGPNGIRATINTSNDTITTLAGSSNAITLLQSSNVVYSNGNDTITIDADQEVVSATGNASIQGGVGAGVILYASNSSASSGASANFVIVGDADTVSLDVQSIVWEEGNRQKLTAGDFAHVDVVGDDDAVTVGTGSYVGIVSGTGATILASASTVYTLNGVSLTLYGSNNSVSGGNDSKFVIVGAGGQTSLGNGSTGWEEGDGQTMTAGSSSSIDIVGDYDVASVGPGSYVGIVSGVGAIINASSSQIYTLGGVSLTLYGSNDVASGGLGATFVIVGANDVAWLGDDSTVWEEGDNQTVVAGTSANVNIVGNNDSASVASGSYVGVVSGIATVIYASRSQIYGLEGVGVTLHGSNNILSSGTSANVVMVGASDEAWLGNGSTAWEEGTGQAVRSGTSSSVYIVGNNDTAAVGAGSYVGIVSGTTAVIDASESDINSLDDNSLTLYGSNNGIGLGSASEGSFYGTGNSLWAGGGNDLYVSGKENSVHVASSSRLSLANGIADQVWADNDTINQTTADGKSSGIYIEAGVQADVFGDHNDLVGSADVSVSITGSNNTYRSANSSSQDSDTATINTLTVSGTSNEVFLGSSKIEVTDMSSTLRLIVTGNGSGLADASDIVKNFGVNRGGIIELSAGIGHYKSGAEAANALVADGQGGSFLPTGNGFGVDFVGLSPVHFAAATFRIV